MDPSTIPNETIGRAPAPAALAAGADHLVIGASLKCPQRPALRVDKALRPEIRDPPRTRCRAAVRLSANRSGKTSRSHFASVCRQITPLIVSSSHGWRCSFGTCLLASIVLTVAIGVAQSSAANWQRRHIAAIQPAAGSRDDVDQVL